MLMISYVKSAEKIVRKSTCLRAWEGPPSRFFNMAAKRLQETDISKFIFFETTHGYCLLFFYYFLQYSFSKEIMYEAQYTGFSMPPHERHRIVHWIISSSVSYIITFYWMYTIHNCQSVVFHLLIQFQMEVLLESG